MLVKVSTGKEGSVENNNYSMLLLLSALGVSVSPVLMVLGVSQQQPKFTLRSRQVPLPQRHRLLRAVATTGPAALVLLLLVLLLLLRLLLLYLHCDNRCSI